MSVYTRLTKEELEQLLNDYNIGDPIDIQGINEGITNSNFYLQTTKSKYILTVFEDKSLNLEYSIHLMELLRPRTPSVFKCPNWPSFCPNVVKKPVVFIC